MTDFVNGFALLLFQVSIFIKGVLLEKEMNFIATLQEVLVSSLLKRYAAISTQETQKSERPIKPCGKLWKYNI